jgi:hypothetical protein
MMVPVMMAPMVVMPMAMVPAMMVPVVMVMPVHLNRLDLIDFVLRHDRRLNARRRHARRLTRERRYGSGLRACGKHDRARDQSGTEIQEIPKFHHDMPLR